MISPPAACRIRAAGPDDAAAISQLIITTLFRSNAGDYPMKVLERVAEVNAPSFILTRLATGDILVATDPSGTFCGTASFDGGWIRSFFVHPDAQGQGVGKRLLAACLERMIAEGETEARLNASLTAQGFYGAAGFEALREIDEDGDRTILMRKPLST